MDRDISREIGRAQASAEYEGMRLDKFMLILMPESGLRERRRVIENGLVTVNGRKCRSGLKMFEGAEVVLFAGQNRECAAQILSAVEIITEGDGYGAVFKPAGVHSAAIAGSLEPSVEECLADIFTGREPILANRLDQLTSGILLVAFGVGQENIFRKLEDEGLVEKYYLAKVHGHPESSFVMKNKLDTADRLQTRVLDQEGEEIRWSRAEIVELNQDGTSLLRVCIAKGARHQIRAHLAHAGFPIVGDPIYGQASEGERMHLHHERIFFDGFEATSPAAW